MNNNELAHEVAKALQKSLTVINPFTRQSATCDEIAPLILAALNAKDKQHEPDHKDAKALRQLEKLAWSGKVNHHAIRSGKLTKPNHCTRCFKKCNPHGHHQDYSKPLEVVWVCPSCHSQIHHEERYEQFLSRA